LKWQNDGQQLAIDANAIFQYQLIGDGSWMAYSYTPSRMWRMARSAIDPIIGPIRCLRTTIMMIVFSLNSIALLDILPEKPNQTSSTSGRISSKNIT
jgi:hypothetical protein